jgi:hypothetical protein
MDSLLSSVRDFFKEHPNPRLSSWAGFSRPLFDKLRAGSAELNSAIRRFSRPEGRISLGLLRVMSIFG